MNGSIRPLLVVIASIALALAACGNGEECVPSCFDRHCGDDGCGGVCGYCEDGMTCEDGTCVPDCPAHLAECDGKCVDLSSDREHCGECGYRCWPEEECMNGVCEVISCTPDCAGRECGPDSCGGSCGECGEGQVCDDGVCVAGCGVGLTECNGACVDLSSDSDNCGACGVTCDPGDECVGGNCVASNGNGNGLVVLAAWESNCVEGSTIAPSTASPENSASVLTAYGVKHLGADDYHTFVCVQDDAFSSRYWNNTDHAEKYWRVQVSTLGHRDIQISSKQSGSSTGPRDFVLQYSTDGAQWTGSGISITLAEDWESGVVEMHQLPQTFENQSQVFIRWLLDSNAAIGGGEISTVGTSRINHVIVEGVSM